MIVGVAIRNENTLITLPRPYRHCDCFAYAADFLKLDPVECTIGMKADDQGFYTHTGRYLNRKDAFKHAKRVKQKLIDNPNQALLSENLW